MPSKRRTSLVCTIVTCIAFGWCGAVRSDDYESVHRVEAGDIISADMINELFDAIENSRRSITADDLIGTWVGTFYAKASVVQSYGNGWQTNALALYAFQTNVAVTFSQTGPGSYELQTSAPNPFRCNSPSALTSPFEVKEGTLFLWTSGPYTIDRISEHRIRLSHPTVDSQYSFLGTLDRRNLPPKKPKLLSASVSNHDVVLAWEDNSDDEDGFNILRRDRPSGTYSNVCTVASDTTCVTNIVPSSGFFWYRIVSTNRYGESVGSNVKRVVVP